MTAWDQSPYSATLGQKYLGYHIITFSQGFLISSGPNVSTYKILWNHGLKEAQLSIIWLHSVEKKGLLSLNVSWLKNGIGYKCILHLSNQQEKP